MYIRIYPSDGAKVGHRLLCTQGGMCVRWCRVFDTHIGGVCLSRSTIIPRKNNINTRFECFNFKYYLLLIIRYCLFEVRYNRPTVYKLNTLVMKQTQNSRIYLRKCKYLNLLYFFFFIKESSINKLCI